MTTLNDRTTNLFAAVLLAAGSSGLLTAETPAAANPGPDTAWVGTNYKAILDAVLPPLRFSAGEFPRDLWWYVSVQVVPRDGKEEVVSLLKFDDGRVEVRITRLEDGDLGDTIAALHEQAPSAGTDAIVASIRVVSEEVSSTSCARVLTEAKRFESLDVRLLSPGALTIHGTGYRFIVSDFTGYRLEGSVSGNQALREAESGPVPRWTESLRRTVARCRQER